MVIIMKIEIAVEGIKQAEKFSAICQGYPFEMLLHSGSFCTDPKSMLGVLAIFYSAKEPVIVDTADMDDVTVKKFVDAIGAYIAK